MADMNKQALEIWGALKPMIDKEIEAKTQGVVQRRKAKVTTAPSLITNKIGVTEPFGDQYFIPFNTNIMSAQVGDVVWVEFMYGATNAFASMFAGADDKDLTVAGDIHVIGDSTFDGDLSVNGDTTFVGDVDFQGNVTGVNATYKMTATLSTAGWYRIANVPSSMLGSVLGFGLFIPFSAGSGLERAEVHQLKYPMVYGANAIFFDEHSSGDTLLIDKIRRTYGGNVDGVDTWGFDIHYAGGATMTVYAELSIEGNTEDVYIEDLESVLDAPSGESVFPTRNLSQRTEGDIASLISFSRTSVSSTVENFWASRRGNGVNIHIQFKATGSISAGSDFWAGTANVPLPPAGASAAAYYTSRAIAARLTSSGELYVRYVTGSGSFSSGNEIDVYFSYVCD